MRKTCSNDDPEALKRKIKRTRMKFIECEDANANRSGFEDELYLNAVQCNLSEILSVHVSSEYLTKNQ